MLSFGMVRMFSSFVVPIRQMNTHFTGVFLEENSNEMNFLQNVLSVNFVKRLVFLQAT